jgi:hypothetical protein
LLELLNSASLAVKQQITMHSHMFSPDHVTWTQDIPHSRPRGLNPRYTAFETTWLEPKIYRIRDHVAWTQDIPHSRPRGLKPRSTAFEASTLTITQPIWCSYKGKVILYYKMWKKSRWNGKSPPWYLRGDYSKHSCVDLCCFYNVMVDLLPNEFTDQNRVSCMRY